jgi:hypothetical protein
MRRYGRSLARDAAENTRKLQKFSASAVETRETCSEKHVAWVEFCQIHPKEPLGKKKHDGNNKVRPF